MLNEIEIARKNAEETIGVPVPDETAEYILGYTMRKFANIICREEKPDGYFGILYQNEIEDFYRRALLTTA